MKPFQAGLPTRNDGGYRVLRALRRDPHGLTYLISDKRPATRTCCKQPDQLKKEGKDDGKKDCGPLS
jgi:hypothetical protein